MAAVERGPEICRRNESSTVIEDLARTIDADGLEDGVRRQHGDDSVSPSDSRPAGLMRSAATGSRSNSSASLRDRARAAFGVFHQQQGAVGKPAPSSPSPTPTPLPAFDLLTLALLAPFSIFGCLARLGLTALFSYDGQSVFPLVWAQAVGCLLMGFALGRKAAFERTALGPALYTAWTTGLCGSITTFSSWMVQTFGAFSNFDRRDRSGLHDATDGIVQIVVTLAVSAFSLWLGRRLAMYLHRPTLSPSASVCRTSSHRSSSVIFPLLAIILSFALYLAAILALALSPTNWTGHRILFALALAPPGTIARFLLSRSLNPVSRRLPTTGTLVSNLLATTLLACCVLLERLRSSPALSNALGCQALGAVGDGFCGSLSTVSTFVAELETLSERSVVEHQRLTAAPSTTTDGHPPVSTSASTTCSTPTTWMEREATWLYLLASVSSGLLIVLLVLGVGWWGSPRGLGPTCQTS